MADPTARNDDAALPSSVRIVVLLVDDQPAIGEAIRKMLGDQPDIELVTCTDPRLALKRAQEIRPSVILQDLVMPDFDGMMLVRFFRAHETTAATPIIVLSSKEEPRDKSRAFALGASDYLIKLPDKIELIARIRSQARSFVAQQQRDHAFRALERMRAELEASNAELKRLTRLDGLTGIANRRRFDESIAEEWKRARRTNRPLALVLIDIDYFKSYNDFYGHVGGDDCLRRVAEALAGAPRRPADLVARYGGEEFAILLPETPVEGAVTVAELARESIAQIAIPHAKSPVAPFVTISQGIAAVVPAAVASPADLIERADKALYVTKTSGRNGYRTAE
jgi:two-component system, chemotaxis family, response regulator WspR